MDTDDTQISETHTAPLGEDSIPDVNQAHFCFSCNSPITGLYCDSCGQKNDNFRRSIFSLISETLGTVIGFESRIWKTWLAILFKPGLVAREYVMGARSKWSSPVRVYLAMSIILFGYLGCTQTQIIALDIDVVPKAEFADLLPPLTDDQVRLQPSLHFMETQKQINARNAGKDLALIERKLSEGIDFSIVLGGEDTSETTDEAETVTPETRTLVVNGLDGEDTTINVEQMSNFMVRLMKNPDIVNDIFMVWIPRLMFLMMPLTMIIGAIFIRGRDALMFDHLVHSAYIHAVMFLIVLFCIIASKVIAADTLMITAFIIMLIYLPLSLKRMFRRGWFKTVLTSYSVGLNYLLVFAIMMFAIFSLEISTAVKTLSVAAS